jgi:hypothetical protein
MQNKRRVKDVFLLCLWISLPGRGRWVHMTADDAAAFLRYVSLLTNKQPLPLPCLFLFLSMKISNKLNYKNFPTH